MEIHVEIELPYTAKQRIYLKTNPVESNKWTGKLVYRKKEGIWKKGSERRDNTGIKERKEGTR